MPVLLQGKKVMDTSKTFIKQVDYPEIQNKAPEHYGDDGRFKFTWYVGNLYVRTGEPINDEGFFGEDSRLIWLPNQGQLWKMLPVGTAYRLLRHSDAKGWDFWIPVPTTVMLIGKTAEQVLIQGVWHEVYNKVWSYEKESWIKLLPGMNIPSLCKWHLAGI